MRRALLLVLLVIIAVGCGNQPQGSPEPHEYVIGRFQDFSSDDIRGLISIYRSDKPDEDTYFAFYMKDSKIISTDLKIWDFFAVGSPEYVAIWDSGKPMVPFPVHFFDLASKKEIMSIDTGARHHQVSFPPAPLQQDFALVDGRIINLNNRTFSYPWGEGHFVRYATWITSEQVAAAGDGPEGVFLSIYQLGGCIVSLGPIPKGSQFKALHHNHGGDRLTLDVIEKDGTEQTLEFPLRIGLEPLE